MLILGIESSCDETSAAVLEQKNGPYLPAGRQVQILSNVVASSADLQAKYGGIIPEQAARKQLAAIIPVLEEALKQAKVKPSQLDATAVTYGPGLIGSLLVGVETAKVLSQIWDKPLIPVNHLLGHFYANWITQGYVLRSKYYGNDKKTIIHNTDPKTPTFPAVGLLVSGGHTDLVLFTGHNKYQYLGGTRDDAAGECFDKCARLLGLPYPGGPKISKIATKGNPKAFNLPRPMIDSKDFDFSFSGLKTAFANLISEQFQVTSIDPKNAEAHWKRIVLDEKKLDINEQRLADLCASIEAAIIEVLVKKTVAAAQKYQVEQIIIAGGVAANERLINDFRLKIKELDLNIRLSVPQPHLCTDNAAMIAAAAFYTKPTKNPLTLQANPNLSLALGL